MIHFDTAVKSTNNYCDCVYYKKRNDESDKLGIIVPYGNVVDLGLICYECNLSLVLHKLLMIIVVVGFLIDHKCCTECNTYIRIVVFVLLTTSNSNKTISARNRKQYFFAINTN